jgi:hypothetical protein
MSPDDYMVNRVDDQIQWYDKKSQSAQWWFKRLSGVEVLSAAAIPLIAGFGNELSPLFPVKLVVGVLGAMIVVISSFVSINQFQEKWIEYRTTCESLKHEKFLFLTKAEPYQNNDAFNLFVQRIESLISKENSAWSQYTQSALEKTKTS